MQVGKKAGVVHLPCALQCDQCPSFSTVVINKSQYNIDTSVSELLKKKRSFFFFRIVVMAIFILQRYWDVNLMISYLLIQLYV